MKCREINKNDFNKFGGLLCEVISQMNKQFNVPMKYNIDKIRAEFDSTLKDQLSIAYGCWEGDSLLGLGVFSIGAAYHEKNTLSFVEKILHPDPTLPKNKQAKIMIKLIQYIEKRAQDSNVNSYVVISAQAETGLPTYLERKGYGDKEISLRKLIKKKEVIGKDG